VKKLGADTIREMLATFKFRIFCTPARFLLKNKTKFKMWQMLISTVVLYECEIWSLKLREEQRLEVLRRMFQPQKEKVRGRWRVRHN
jgi:hypothetical protein